eukprot:TRINITY_DN65496_c0_g1_i2.p2 TRINITY_DN65496_c0_g1~~TRINITY_DN65496_c0_g1_i2.p2  ORF type:complete len:113 (-),score=21.86 TRINITY_DN65496_c0_g1_i2:426-764(-)
MYSCLGRHSVSNVNEFVIFFFFKQKTAYEMQRGLVGSEMCIRDRIDVIKTLRKINYKNTVNFESGPWPDMPEKEGYQTAIKFWRTCEYLTTKKGDQKCECNGTLSHSSSSSW